MSRSLSPPYLLAAALLVTGAHAADEPKPAQQQGAAVKVLVLSGVPETHHDYRSQCPNMAEVLKKEGHDVVLRDRAIIEEEDAGKFDVLVR